MEELYCCKINNNSLNMIICIHACKKDVAKQPHLEHVYIQVLKEKHYQQLSSIDQGQQHIVSATY